MAKPIISTEELRARLFNNRGTEYILIGNSKGVKSKNLIKHTVCGHEWQVIINDVIRGKSNCPMCSNMNSKSGFDPSKPSILYFFSFPYLHYHCYKIGITNRTLAERHKLDTDIIDPIWEFQFETGTIARKLEKLLLDKYKSFSINTGMLHSGNTETITAFIDRQEVLELIANAN